MVTGTAKFVIDLVEMTVAVVPGSVAEVANAICPLSPTALKLRVIVSPFDEPRDAKSANYQGAVPLPLANRRLAESLTSTSYWCITDPASRTLP